MKQQVKTKAAFKKCKKQGLLHQAKKVNEVKKKENHFIPFWKGRQLRYINKKNDLVSNRFVTKAQNKAFCIFVGQFMSPRS